MAHIDFEQHFLRYNLAQIYLDMTSEDPRLGAFEIPVALATDFILGRYFTEELSQALLLSILDNQRCISIGMHPMMASRIAFEQSNEARFQAHLPLQPQDQYMVQDAVCELNFFQHRFDDTSSLRSLVSLLSYENQMADIDVGEVHFYHVFGSVIEHLKLGYNRFQIHIPQSVIEAVKLYGRFALELND